MKILAANKRDWTHPMGGGAELNLKETLTRLAEKGHEVHLITSRYPDSPSYEELKGVKIHRYGLKGRNNELFILSLGQIYFNMLIRDLDPDIVYATTSNMTWLPLFKRDRTVVAIHHLNGKTLLNQLNFPLNIIGYLTEKIGFLLSKNKEIITGSPEIAKELVNRGVKDEKITTIKHGIKSEKYEPGEKTDKPSVLYLGRLEYSKGADLLPKIHRSIQKEFGDYTLEIAGFGRRKEEIRDFAKNKERVNFHGYVSEEKKEELLQSSWVLIIPSRKEGWGLTVTEAAASGTPAVGFRTGGLQTSIKEGKTGLLVKDNPPPKDNIENFARSVKTILEDKEKRKELSKNALKATEKLGWDRTTENLEKLFKKVKEG